MKVPRDILQCASVSWVTRNHLGSDVELTTEQSSTEHFDVVVLLFPGVTQLDYVGPVEVFGRCPGARIHLAAREPQVVTDLGAVVVPSCNLAEAPSASVLLIPGGPGIVDAMADSELLAFVEAQAAGASWVCSVCTGSFVLGAAGLLKGRRATTHWASHPMLAELGCIPVEERVVVDRPFATAAGVSAGIDLALWVAGEVFGARKGSWIEMSLEYAPQPPFGTGAAVTAPPHWVAKGREAMRAERLNAVQDAARRMHEN